jgi:hypothetical protein
MLREIGEALSWVSIVLVFGSFIWSIVSASRFGFGWFLGVGFLWIIFYPAFLITHWKSAKASFFGLIAGLAVFAISFSILAVTNPHKQL